MARRWGPGSPRSRTATRSANVELPILQLAVTICDEVGSLPATAYPASTTEISEQTREGANTGIVNARTTYTNSGQLHPLYLQEYLQYIVGWMQELTSL
jgi:hypothetical protein